MKYLMREFLIFRILEILDKEIKNYKQHFADQDSKIEMIEKEIKKINFIKNGKFMDETNYFELEIFGQTKLIVK